MTKKKDVHSLQILEDILIQKEYYKSNPQKEVKEAFTERSEKELVESLFMNISNKDTESPFYEEHKDYTHKERDGLWDVLLDEPIEYFDPLLSYEITGYRPINKNSGLDFNPNDFTQTANIFKTTGRYTEYPPGSKPYAEFWTEELKRCSEGYTVGKYRLTGDHYFFLNFYRMQVVNLEANSKVKGRREGFPGFMSKQYEFFHYIEMCEKIGKDCIMLKARGLGFSEILACIGVRPFITTREFNTVYTAFAENQLKGVLDKCWRQLDWLSMNTDGGMRRQRMKIDQILHKRASLVDNEAIEYGRMSNIKGIVADNPRKVRGDRTERLIFEEFGSNIHGVTSWVQGESLVDLGGEKIGIMVGGGCVCAGTKVWTKDGRYINIEDLKQEDGIIGFKDGKSNIEPISYIQEPAYKPCVRITTDYGILECSEDHPILTKIDHKHYDWVEAKNLIETDIIAYCEQVDIFGNDTLEDNLIINNNFKLPSNYNNLNKESSYKLIANILDSDICRIYNYNLLEIDNNNVDNLKELRTFLYKFGIYTDISCTEDFKWFLHTRSIQTFKNIFENIPINDGTKILNVLKSIEDNKWKLVFETNGIIESNIKGIKSIGIQRIYNLTADDSNTYLANNIITHNTGSNCRLEEGSSRIKSSKNGEGWDANTVLTN